MILWAALLACTDLDGDGTRRGRDCDDLDPSAHHDGVEICDGVDNDCDGQIDEDVAIVAFLDRDGDGYGQSSQVRRVCELPPDGARTGGDCDDTTAALHPGVPEICDGVDNDCNGVIDDDLTTAWFLDVDGDGAGSGRRVEGSRSCTPPPGFAATDDDCDDDDPTVFVGAPETCDGDDDDCDGLVDEGLPPRRVWRDADGDGSGDPGHPGVACGTVAGWSVAADDCDDADGSVFPGGTEIRGNPVDDDCDGWLDEWSIPGDHPTLAAAWEDAPDGAVVQLDPGRHLGTWILRDRPLTLAGAGCGRTLLDGGQAGSVLTMQGGTLAGLTVTNGIGTPNPADGLLDGGGLLVRGDVEVVGVCFDGNRASGRGGAIAVVDDGSATIDASRFSDNRASIAGGGVWSDGAVVHVARTAFVANEAFDAGGAVAADAGEVIVEQSRFVANRSGFGGSAIALRRGNRSTGGDLSAKPAGTARITNATFVDNTTSGGNAPAAVHHVFASATVGRSLFAGNGGVAVFASVGRDLVLRDNGIVDQPDLREGRDSTALREPTTFFAEGRLLPTSPYLLADIGTTHDRDALAEDRDRDGLPDGWARRYGVPADQDATSDPDGDGLSHAIERELGTDPFAPDTDDDGVDDGIEATLHDPLDPLDHRPTVSAGRDRMALVGRAVGLNATAFDPDDDALGVTWTVTEAPIDSVATVLGATFVPDLPGRYVLEVAVDDGRDVVSDVVVVDAFAGVVVPDDHPDLASAIRAIGNDEAVALRPGVHVVDDPLGGLPAARSVLRVFGLGEQPGDVELRPAGPGAVLTLHRGILHLADVRVAGGRNRTDGGGLRIDGDAHLARVELTDNQTTALGGGLAVFGDLHATGLRIIANDAERGGGLHVAGELSLHDSVVEANRAVAIGGMSVAAFTQVAVVRSVFAFNEGGGAVVDLDSNNGRATLANTAFWRNDAALAVDHGGVDLTAVDVLFEGNTLPPDGPLFAGGFGTSIDVIGLQADHPVTASPLFPVRTTPPALRPTAARGALDNVWDPRLGSSVVDAGWIAEPDADGSRSDHVRRGLVPMATRWGQDLDGDGLSDGWELHMGLDPTIDDAAADPDADGLSNAVEHTLGTRPDRLDSDGDGTSDADDALPLDPRNHRPVAVVGAAPVGTTAGEPVLLDGSGSLDPDGTALTYAWRLTRAPDDTLTTSAGSSFVFTPTVPGAYGVELVVTSDGVSSRPVHLGFTVLPTLRVPDDLSLEQALATASAGSRILIGAGDFSIDQPLTRDLILEGQGPTTRLLGRASLTGARLELRSVTWTGGIGDRGGALHCSNGTLDAHDVVFRGNHAREGGAVYMEGCTALWQDVDVIDNGALRTGGGVFVRDGAFSQIRGLYRDNEAIHGGGIRGIGQSIDLHNVRFVGNLASSHGGALAHAGSGGAELQNVTLLDNRGPNGSQLSLQGAGSVTDSVVRGPAPLLDGPWVSARTTFSSGSGRWPVVAVSEAPREGTLDLRLPTGSPAIDAGSGQDRDGSPGDRGAYGGPLAPDDWDLWQRDLDGDQVPDGYGQFWGLGAADDPDGDRLTTLQELANGTSPVDADTDGDGLTDDAEVLDGTDPLLPDGKATTLQIDAAIVAPATPVTVSTVDATAVRWRLVHQPLDSTLSPVGFDVIRPMVQFVPDRPGRYTLGARAPIGPEARIDLLVTGDLVVPVGAPDLHQALRDVAPGSTVVAGGPWTGPVVIDRDVIVDGLGTAVWSGDRAQQVVRITHDADVTILGVTVEDGRAVRGGGVEIVDGTARLVDVEVRRCAAVDGGGLHTTGPVQITDSTVVDSHAARDGGGIWSSGALVVDDAVLAGNRAANTGGGLFQSGASVTASHLLVVDSRASVAGGLALWSTDAAIDQATLGHLDGDPLAFDLVGTTTLELSASLVVGDGVHPLFAAEPSITPIFTGGGYFAIDPASEPFPLSPVDPAFDFGPLTDDADWTDDAWGRTTSMVPGPGYFGG